jgi:FkbM family methyltransferase
MQSNGELLLLELVMEQVSGGGQVVMCDVGANVGEWTLAALDIASRSGVADIRIHCFEPHPATHHTLATRIGGHPKGGQVELHQVALSDHDGTTAMHVVGDNAGTNSLHMIPEADAGTIMVRTKRLDDLQIVSSPGRIAFVKIDAEGHDMRVLVGLQAHLRSASIAAIQFEYNHRWVYSRHYLKDVFELIEGSNYSLGKITPHGVEFYKKWHAELETFREGNYVLCRNDLLVRLPKVQWWMEES